MKKEMLINAVQDEECRIAILEDGVLEELYVERTSHESYVGNIYKGRIVNIEPSIQAAFVDFGVGRNGFLHVSDVEPEYYRHLLKDDEGRGQRRRGGRRHQRAGVSRPAAVIPSGAEHKKSRHDDDFTPEEHDDTRNMLDDRDEAPNTFDNDNRPDAAEQSDTGDDTHIEIPESVRKFAEELGIDPEVLAAADLGPVTPPATIVPPALGDASLISVINESADMDTADDQEDEDDKTTTNVTNESDDDLLPFPDPEVKLAEQPEDNTPAEEDAVTGTVEVEVIKEETDETPVPMDSVEHRTREDGAVAEQDEDSDDGLSFRTSEISDDSLSFRTSEFDEVEDETPTETETGDAGEEPRYEIEDDMDANEDRGHDFSDEDLSFSLNRSTEELADREEDDTIPEESFSRKKAGDDKSETKPKANEAIPVVQPSLANLDDDDVGYMPRRSSRGRGGPRRHTNNRRSGRHGMSRPKPLIQDIFKKGQEVLVQVIKEGLGTKGPTLSTYISIAGRYLVLMPGLNRIGVSRKITDEDQRRRLRDILVDLKPPKGLGFIIRTAGVDRSQKELQRDLSYLSRLWQVVARRIKKFKGPSEIYQESDMITRTIRDTFSSDIQTIWVDAEKSYEHAKEFLQIVMPRYANRIKHYQGQEPIFHKNGLEDEIGKIQDKHVPLRNGGSVVIEQTEALVAVDVNSGNFRADDNAEETAYQMNLLAAKEIARQLRLRDLGGVIVNDFIDMRDEKHRRNVERALRDAVRRDRARTKILRMSAFGIIEMTRQRIRPSLKRSVYEECSHCDGDGLVKTAESMSIDVMRKLQTAAAREHVTQIQVQVSEDVGNYLLNRKRRELYCLEEETKTRFHITSDPCAPPEFLEFICYDNNGHEIAIPTERMRQPFVSRGR